MNADNANIVIDINSTATAVKAKVGRPSVPVVIPTKGSFTLKDLETANPTVKPVTLRAHVIRSLANGTVTKLVNPVRTGKRGKPAAKFMLTEALTALKAKDLEKVKRKVKVVETAEVAEVA